MLKKLKIKQREDREANTERKQMIDNDKEIQEALQKCE